jgi:hypothetical protein
MAFVGISERFIDEVGDKISKMRDAEISALGGNTSDEIDYESNKQWMDNLLWDGRLDLKPLLPDTWIPKHSRAYIQLIHQQGNDGNIIEVGAGEFVCRFKEEIGAAPRYSTSYTPSLKVRFKDINEIPAALQACVQYRLDKHQVASKWSQIKDKVITFFRSCKSVNEAIKLWPDVRMYIPTEYMERVERKAARGPGSGPSDAMSVLATMNLEEIQAAAVVARLSGAKV